MSKTLLTRTDPYDPAYNLQTVEMLPKSRTAKASHRSSTLMLRLTGKV